MPDYARLAAHLRTRAAPQVILTFEAIEAILGEPLPLAARVQSGWWRLAPGPRTPQARAWSDAGWRVEQVDLYTATVTLVPEADD